VVYGEKRDYERAEAVYRKVVALPRTFGGAFTNLLREQIRNGRLTALDSTVAAFRARYPASNDLWEVEWYAAWAQGQHAEADSIGRAVHARARTSRQAIRAAFGTGLLAYLHGQRREGQRWMTLGYEALVRADPSVANRLIFAMDTAGNALYEGDAALARAVLARGLVRHPVDSMPPTDRPWEDLAQLAAAASDPALARRALTGFEQDQASLSRDPVGRRAFFAGHVALAEGRWDQAIPLLQQADAATTIEERYALVQIGRAFDLAGRSDSAIVYYQKFLGKREAEPENDARWRARTHRWLGALYEAKGESKKAIEQYAQFLELWRQADPSLQPQVEEIRGQLGRLRAKVG